VLQPAVVHQLLPLLPLLLLLLVSGAVPCQTQLTLQPLLLLPPPGIALDWALLLLLLLLLALPIALELGFLLA
jgi:hypothetical protein